MRHFYSFMTMAAICSLFLASNVIAMPQFAASTGQPCSQCHANPTGCWMRNTYGAQYFAQMSLPVHKIAADQVTKFTPAISDNISLGADIRTLYLYREFKGDSSTRTTSTFFQMENNFYINAQLGDKFSLSYYIDPSFNFFTSYQAWGMANILPFNGYVRAGRFQPSYGWRFADHTSFVRDSLGWSATYSDPGMEIGLNPTDISFNAGLFNGNNGPADIDKGKSLAARLELRRKFDFLGAAVGGSYWRNDLDSATVSMYGPFYYVSLFDGKVVYLGELDWLKNIHSDSLKMVTTHNLFYVPIQGIWLGATYDFSDPNTKVKSGSTTRYAGVANIFPIAFMEIEPMVRYYSIDLGPGIAKNHLTEYMMKFHFFF